MYSIMSLSTNNESSIYFLIWNPCISFSSLLAIARNSKTMLNNSGNGGHICLIPDPRGNAFSFSLLRIMFAVGLLYMTFIIWCGFIIYVLYNIEVSSSMPIFWRVSIKNGSWILLKAFPTSIESITKCISLNLLIGCITLLDLHILNNSCIHGINTILLWHMDFLMCC